VARTILKNKPLVEAIFELRLKLQGEHPNIQSDPNYKLLLGSIHSHFKGEYPFFEQLPTTLVPDDLAAYLVQYRFRASEGAWPPIQLGPGIITLNETAGYDWDKDFYPRIGRTVSGFFTVYPGQERPLVQSLILRYIDAVAFDYEHDNVFDFLRDMMKIRVELLPGLFEGTGIDNRPKVIDLRFSFPSASPPGSMSLRFASGQQNGHDTLIWETVFESTGPDLPQTDDAISAWAAAAHTITSDWFFKIIDGELQRRFE